MTDSTETLQNLPAESQSTWFYRDLPLLKSFENAADGRNHQPLPSDWWLIVSDVKGSTTAIEQGRYQNVNTVGASTIVAVLNVNRDIPIPFVFGGDGATLAIPPAMLEGVRAALLGVQQMARDGFGLELRVGLIPVRDLLAIDSRTFVGKYKISDTVEQTALSGFGWQRAELWLKDPEINQKYQVDPSGLVVPNADFTGFECRWSPIKARRDHKLALIVLSTLQDPTGHMELYQNVINKVKDIYGDDALAHPLDVQSLAVSLNPAKVLGEIKVRTHNKNVLIRLFYSLFAISTLYLGRFFMTFGVKALGVNWGQYRKEVVENADYRKFDGMLKIILDGTDKQKTQLCDFLQAERNRGKLLYGVHSSESAIMTCIVFSHSTNHAHFVDGSDGGYAMAAKMLKAQIAKFKAQPTRDA